VPALSVLLADSMRERVMIRAEYYQVALRVWPAAGERYDVVSVQ
jgi:hypothetical protein